MLQRQLILGVIVSVVLVATLWFIAPERNPLSSGPLTDHHADVSCHSCHSPMSSFQDDDKCLACHNEDKDLTREATYTDVRCVHCHKEHRGSGATLANVGNDKCMGCHDWQTVHTSAPVVLAWKLKEPPTNCLKCHGNHDEHRLAPEPSIADARKHLVAAHQKGGKYYHKNACVKCHQDKTTASGATAAAVPGFFDPHVTHVSRLSIRCTWCHESVDIVGDGGTRIRRSVRTDRCVQCHAGEYYVAEAAAGVE